jgi:phosphatidylglycerophosphate synthase
MPAKRTGPEEMDEPAPTGDRRPIAARGHVWSQAAAGFLIRRRASPNAISIAGMIAAMLAGVCFARAPFSTGPIAIALWLFGALLVQTRLLANMFDGMVALGRGVASPVGELYNDVPDRVSDTAVFLGLGWAAGDLALGLAAALAAMATAYIRALGRGLGAPGDFGGPMAKQHRMSVVTVVAVVECVTPAGWNATLADAALWLITLGALLTAALRLSRTAAWLRARP